MLLRELSHDSIVKLDSVHINRAEPSLWLAFDYADHDLYEMIRFHQAHRENRRENPTGKVKKPFYDQLASNERNFVTVQDSYLIMWSRASCGSC